MASPAAILSVLVRADTGKASAALLRFNTHLGETDKKANKASAALKTLSKGALIGTGAGLAYAVKKAADFEQQLDSLASVSGASAKQMERFRKEAMKAGAETKFSALEAAKAQTELAKGGLRVAQISRGGLKSALALAAAGELELADAASTTANALNLFGLRGKESMKVADALATAANATTADVEDFAMALKMGGSVAKMAGLSFTETVLALEALAKVGIRNSDAGTSLKTSLIQLIKPTQKQFELQKSLGLEFINSAGNMKSMSQISEMLRKKTEGMTRAQRTATFATLAGTDGVRTLSSLYAAGPARLDKWRKGLDKSGTAAKVAAEKQDNLKGKLENLQGSIETLAISVGQSLIPPLVDGAEKLTKFINQMQTGKGAGGKFADAVERLADALKEIVKFAVAHPALTALLTALGLVGKNKAQGKVGGIGGIIGGAKPIPVFVVNKGFGVPGGGGTPMPVPGGGKGGGTLGKAGKALKWVPIIGARGNAVGFALTALVVAADEHVLPDNNVGRREGRRRATQTPSGRGANIPGSSGLSERVAAQEKARLEQSKQLHESWRKKVRAVTDANTAAYERNGNLQTQVLSRSGKKLSELRMHTARETQRIKERFSEDTNKGQAALARNYRRAAEVARNQMASTGRVTKDGLAFIRRMMANELRLYGLSEESIKFRLEGKEQSGKTIGAPLVGKQFGGMMVPGSGSGDKVHMQAMVEPGEQIFVLNRNATSALQQLEHLNASVPRFRSGGAIPRRAGGGILELLHPGNDPAHQDHLHIAMRNRRRLVALGHRLQRMGWLVGENPAFGGVSGGHATNSYHYSGQAIDVNWPDAGAERAKIAALLPMLGSMKGLGGMAKAIRPPGVKGRGPLRDILQDVMRRTTKAANHRLAALTAPMASMAGISGGGTPSANQAIGLQMARRYGWGGGQWRALKELWNRESGWDNNARNPSSGAYGIPQALPATKMPRAAQRGNAASQIRWGLNYIKGRYGTPRRALAWHNSHNWYQRGGLVKAQRGGRIPRFQWGGDTGLSRWPWSHSWNSRDRFGWGEWRGQEPPWVRRLQREWRRIQRRQNRPMAAPGSAAASEYLSNTFEYFNNRDAMGSALAALTPDRADDIANAQRAIATWTSWLGVAQQNNDVQGITTAATNIKTWQDTLADLQSSTDEQNDLLQQQIDATKDHTDAVNALRAEQKQTRDLVNAQGPALTAALIQTINGGIGGNAGLGRQFPSSTGLDGLSRA